MVLPPFALARNAFGSKAGSVLLFFMTGPFCKQVHARHARRSPGGFTRRQCRHTTVPLPPLSRSTWPPSCRAKISTNRHPPQQEYDLAGAATSASAGSPESTSLVGIVG